MRTLLWVSLAMRHGKCLWVGQPPCSASSGYQHHGYYATSDVATSGMMDAEWNDDDTNVSIVTIISAPLLYLEATLV